MNRKIYFIVFFSVILILGLFKEAITQDSMTENELNQPVPKGKLSVVSDPTGAEVYITNSKKSITPINEEIEIGEYSLKIAAVKWQAEKLEINIFENKTTLINALLIKPVTSKLSLSDIGREYKKPVNSIPGMSIKMKETWIPPRNKFKSELVYVSGVAGIATGFIFGGFLNAKDGGEGGVGLKESVVLFGSVGLVIGIIQGFLHKEDGYYEVNDDNMDYNNKLRVKIREKNKIIEDYNRESERLLEIEKQKDKEKIREFNANRNTTVEYQDY